MDRAGQRITEAEFHGTGGAAEIIADVYYELHALASSYLRNERSDHTLQTTALVHEAWLRLSKSNAKRFDSRAHYFRAAALAMRRILVHHAEKKHTQKRGGGQQRMPLDDSIAPPDATGPDPLEVLAINDALKRLAAIDFQKAQVVELRYFGGCSIEETAEAIGIGTATVEREWRFSRAWLRTALNGAGESQDESPLD